MTGAASAASGRAADDAVLAIDVGLTNCKAVLFALDGRILRRAAIPCRTRRPRPGWVEQDPEDWWTTTVAAVRALDDRSGARPPRIAAVAVTALRPLRPKRPAPPQSTRTAW